RLLVETDAPYLTPEPVRAIKRNEHAHVVHILTYLAELRGEATDELAQATAANTRRLFWRMQAQ
ncbi:MAG: TatD family hydrolase, partial [Proteobacteria bacterium]|nr:TatD family hydrolase [Pseudomonadota bacterium]